MSVASRKSRLAKIARSSCTKVPPNSAGARLGAEGQAEQHDEPHRPRATPTERRSSSLRVRSPAKKTRRIKTPSPARARAGCPVPRIIAALRGGSAAAPSRCRPGPRAMPGAHAEEHEHEDEDDEGGPLRSPGRRAGAGSADRGSCGPQKICLVDAEHVDRREERADHAGEEPPRDAATARRRGTSGTRRRNRPSRASPSEDRPPMVKAVAIPGIIWPKPPILKISRECAFS